MQLSKPAKGEASAMGQGYHHYFQRAGKGVIAICAPLYTSLRTWVDELDRDSITPVQKKSFLKAYVKFYAKKRWDIGYRDQHFTGVREKFQVKCKYFPFYFPGILRLFAACNPQSIIALSL